MKRKTIDKQELQQRLLEFAQKQSNDYCDEWYLTPYELYGGIMEELAAHLGLELVVPEIKPQRPMADVTKEVLRKQLMDSLKPELEKLFDMRYRQLTGVGETK